MIINASFRDAKESVAVFTIAVILMGFTGCRGKADIGQQPAVVPMRVVTDDLGRSVTIPVKITRVVSTAPSVTENIFAVGAGDRLVGVTTFCNYPEQAKEIAKIGDTMTPNMESIIALKPDVVFVSTASQIEAFMKTLEANGIAVYVTNPTGPTDIITHLTELGEIFDTQNVAETLTENLTQRINAVGNRSGVLSDRREARPISVFVQISKEPLFTIGEASHLNEWLFTAGGYSATAHVKTAYPKLSKETALALDPQVIILSESPDNQEPNDAFKNSPAVKNGRVYRIDADLLSRPGPRLVDALEQIARDLHPEKFH